MPLRGKRARTGYSAPRPIDKKLTVIQKNDVTGTQESTIVLAPTSACTVMGIRWSLFIQGDAGTVGAPHDYRWVIVHQRDGQNLTALSSTDAASLYSPEQDVLAFGVGTDNNSGTASSGMQGPFRWEGKTGSMRKLMVGDKIVFVVEGIATETVRCKDCVQVFCKF